MEDVSGKITLYHNLFLACLVLFFIFLIISVTLFFVLRVPEVISYLTGRAAKKGIQQLEAGNTLTGTLSKRRERTNMLYVDQKMKEDMGVSPGVVKPGARHVEHAVSDPSGSFRNVSSGQDMTENISANAAEQVTETSVLNVGSQETSVLNSDDELGGTEVLNKEVSNSNSSSGFVTEQEIIMVHTEEVI